MLPCPSASDTLTHDWTIAGAAAQPDCDAFMAGTIFQAANVCRTTLLRRASEVLDDGIGNDNGLCESNESCLYHRNYGRYAGHGPLVSAGPACADIGTGGAVENVTLLQPASNGY